jgi:hypothetical protein
MLRRKLYDLCFSNCPTCQNQFVHICEDLTRGQSPLLGGSLTRLSVDSGVLIPGLAGSLPW